MHIDRQPPTCVLPPTVNLHVVGHCNYACRFCYARFEKEKTFLPLADAQSLLAGFRERGVTKATFAGGEPTLHPELPQMLEAASELGLVTALVTNASRWDRNLCRLVFPHLRWLVVSCDSAVDATCEALGRSSARARAAHPELVRRLCGWVREWNAHRPTEEHVRLKINMVVTRLNAHENPAEFLRECAPERVKVLQCVVIPDENDDAADLVCDGAAFDAYVERLRVLEPEITIVGEAGEDIYDSYAMIGPRGEFRQSRPTGYVTSDRVLDVGIDAAWQQVGGCDHATFERRGGAYDPGKPARGRRLPIIAIEGLDGSGKSSTVQALAERLGAAVVRNPPEGLERARASADEADPTARRAFYLDGNRRAFELAVDHVFAGRPVVLDRSVASTLAFGRAEQGEVASARDRPKAAPLPDRTFLLELPEEERRRRHRYRGLPGTDEEQRLVADAAFRERVMAGYRALCTDVVDAAPGTEGIVDEVVRRLHPKGGGA